MDKDRGKYLLFIVVAALCFVIGIVGSLHLPIPKFIWLALIVVYILPFFINLYFMKQEKDDKDKKHLKYLAVGYILVFIWYISFITNKGLI